MSDAEYLTDAENKLGMELVKECPECKKLLRVYVEQGWDNIRGHWTDTYFKCSHCFAEYTFIVVLHRRLRNIKVECSVGGLSEQ